MPSSNSGKWSLAGFVYQMVGLGGLVALAHDVPTDTDDEVALFVRLLPGMHGQHEDKDRDAILRWAAPAGDNAATDVQFKHSGTTPPKKIYRGEFVGILDQLIRPPTPPGTPDHPVTKYALVTNRPLSDELDRCIEPGGGRLRTWRSGCDLDESLGEDRLTALGSMAFISGSVVDWEAALRRFARQNGCLDDEIESGINQVIGYIARSTIAISDPVTITETVLLEAFTGSQHARPLLPRTAKPSAELVFRSFREDRARTRGTIVRRDKDAELWEISRNCPVVLVKGQGGSGKTVALWRWASGNVGGHMGSGAFGDARYAPEVPDHWVPDLVRRWREPDPTPLPRDDSVERAIARLLGANEGLDRPVLRLGVDGMDVYLPTAPRNSIRDLVRSLIQLHNSGGQGEPPPCSLVMTCRTPEELDRTLFLGGGYDSAEFGGIGTVELGDFEPGDLAYGVIDTANEGLINPEVAERLSSALFRLSPEGSPLKLRVVPLTPEPQISGSDHDIPGHILGALRHPAMWRAFLDTDVRELHQEVLHADPIGLRRLATIFVRRFEHQTEERMGDKLIRAGIVHDVLQSVALSMSKTSAAAIRPDEWQQAAENVPDVSRVVAVELRHEAETFGVLTPAGDAWTWRHSFVGEYLATL